MSNLYVECCRRRCKLRHWESERTKVPSRKKAFRGLGVSSLVCPACGHDEYYKLPVSDWPTQAVEDVACHSE